MKLRFHVIFWIGLLTAFWQWFEYGFKLMEAGIIQSAIWSGTLGYPIPHHGMVGFILVFASYFISNYDDFKKYEVVIETTLRRTYKQ